MARPSVVHQGFLIPNAKDVVEPILSEPDKIDFNTMTNARWGVLTGCLVTGNGGSTLSVSEGAAMVDGKFVVVPPVSNLTVTVPPGAPRFSLVVINDDGVARVIPGKDSTDPVFPDPARNETVLAAVFCKTGVSVADSVIDKRKFLPPALLTKIDPTNDLIRNYFQPGTLITDPPKNYYRVLGSGETIWSNDTKVYRSAAQTLRVEEDLSVKRKITAGDDIKGLTITATENVTAKNLRRQGAAPAAPRLGDLWQSSDTGRIYVGNKRADGVTLEWDEIATHNGAIPPGTIITSLEAPARMQAAGWLPLDGKFRANETIYPNLFKIAALVPYFTAGTVAPNRTMVMPDCTGRVMIGDATNAGFRGPLVPGTQTLRPNNNIALAITHMPKHHHANANQATKTWKTRAQGASDLTVTVNDATLTHAHSNNDDGHFHAQATARLSGASLVNGAPDGSSVFCLPASGRVAANVSQAKEALAAIIVNNTVQTHKHTANISDLGNHQHDLDVVEVGSGSAFSITPNFFTTYMYIKS